MPIDYAIQTWTAPEGTFLNRFSKSGETDSSVELVHNPALTNTPTPFTTTRMNHMEAGILAAADLADHLNDPNAITAVDDIPAAGTGTYTGASITGAPETGDAIYQYSGGSVSGLLRCRCGTNYAREYERIRAGSAWATAWMYAGLKSAMVDDTEYLIGYNSSGNRIYKRTITGNLSSSGTTAITYTTVTGTCSPRYMKTRVVTSGGIAYFQNYYYDETNSYKFYINSVSPKNIQIVNNVGSAISYRITIEYIIS